MRIGELNTLVTIELKTRERDDLLNLSEKWGVYDRAWCSAELLSANEAAVEQQTTATGSWVFQTHWSEKLDGVTTAMRLRLEGGQLLGIRSVTNEKRRNREITIVAEEAT